MLEQSSRLIVIVLLGCSMLSGCACMTKRGREQIAYEHYIKKNARNRVKQKQKFKAGPTMPVSMPPKDTVKSSVSESPESVTSGNEN